MLRAWAIGFGCGVAYVLILHMMGVASA